MGSSREKPLLALATRSRDRLLQHVGAAGGLVAAPMMDQNRSIRDAVAASRG
jgi:hypothetical protein